MRILSLAVCSMILASCASPEPLAFTSSSGKPERNFGIASVDVVKTLIVDACITGGWQITEQGTSSVTCWRTMDGMAGAFATALIGNSYSTPATMNTQFVILKRGDDTIATVTRSYMQTQMAFGQINQQPITANKNLNNWHSWLQALEMK